MSDQVAEAPAPNRGPISALDLARRMHKRRLEIKAQQARAEYESRILEDVEVAAKQGSYIISWCPDVVPKDILGNILDILQRDGFCFLKGHEEDGRRVINIAWDDTRAQPGQLAWKFIELADEWRRQRESSKMRRLEEIMPGVWEAIHAGAEKLQYGAEIVLGDLTDAALVQSELIKKGYKVDINRDTMAIMVFW